MNNKKIKLLLYISSLSGGGAERQFSYLLANLDRKKFDIILCLSKNIIKYECPQDIKKYTLNKKHFYDFFKMFFRFRKIVLSEKPNIILSTSFTCNLLVLILKSFYKKEFKLIIRECTNPTWYKNQFPEIIYMPLLRGFYPAADLIISPSKGVRDVLVRLIGCADKQLFVHNMIDKKMVLELSEKKTSLECLKENAPVIISVGRLDKNKGYEYLLPAFKRVRGEINCYLIILGDGPEKEPLKNLANKLDVNDNTLFLGAVENPFKYIVESSIFVFPSLFESFGNVLVEAMVLGVPVVSTRAPYGPAEIIENETSGFLVPTKDPDALADKMLALLNNPMLRHKFSEAGKKRVEDCFLIENQIKKFENIFLRILED